MSFTSFYFWALFLPVVLLLYYLLGRNATLQNTILLAGSVVFYSCYDAKYLVMLGCCILLTYSGALLAKAKHARWILRGTIVINLCVLAVFKYTGFLLGNLSHLGVHITAPALLLPVGISYYIFQSTAYLFEVGAETVEPEKNLLNYALYVSFFPTITAGPIQRSKNLLPQLRARRNFDGAQFRVALLLFLWGAFEKMVIADRLVLFVNQVFGNINSYSGCVLAVGALMYTVQLYMDFAGYSSMAIAVSLFLGIRVPANFRQPFFATTVGDIWRRWHISLTSWLRDFVYIPLGGNRKGALRQYINIAIVFVLSGMWHGAGWNFIFWGAMQAFYQIVGKISLPLRCMIYKKLGLERDCTGHRCAQRLCVLVLFSFSFIFFRCGSMGDAIHYITRMFGTIAPWTLTDGTLTVLGLTGQGWSIALLGLLVVFAVSFTAERGGTTELFLKQNAVVRLVCYQLLFFAIVIFGMYGPEFSAGAFIYAGF